VNEQNLVWVKRPASKTKAQENAIDEAELADRLRAGCTGCGYQFKQFIAAKGAFGSWLVQLEKDGLAHRIIWNGQDGKLLLEAAGRHAGWTELASCPASGRDIDGFVASVETLLGQAHGGPGEAPVSG